VPDSDHFACLDIVKYLVNKARLDVYPAKQGESMRILLFVQHVPDLSEECVG